MAWAGRELTGTWMPVYVGKSSSTTAILLVFCAVITSSTFGYDQSMLNGLNILPSYTDYFVLTPATTGLQTSSLFIGGALAGLCWGQVTDVVGRRASLLYASMITIIAVVLQTAAINVAMFTIGCAGPPFLAETLPLVRPGEKPPLWCKLTGDFEALARSRIGVLQ
nr:putative metabolite transport protein yfig [Quercus suber]